MIRSIYQGFLYPKLSRNNWSTKYHRYIKTLIKLPFNYELGIWEYIPGFKYKYSVKALRTILDNFECRIQLGFNDGTWGDAKTLNPDPEKFNEVQKLLNIIEDTPEATVMHFCYSKIDGGLIGTFEDAYTYHQLGIYNIQKADPADKSASIGELNIYGVRYWCGWSHRAMCKFKIGDTVQADDCVTSSGYIDEYIKEHPEKDKSLPVGFVAKTNADCKRMAIAFAFSVR